MLKDNLLLDSARPFSDEEKDEKIQGRSESNVSGVPDSCHMSAAGNKMWHVLRVSYSRELKIQDALCNRGVRTFVPMMWRKKEVAGKVKKLLVPAVNNLCFAFSDRVTLEDFIRSYGENSPVHFYWERASRSPMVVPSKAMEDFIKVSATMDEDLIYMTAISPKLREGQSVKVKSGAFAGIEGKIVRIRKSRRIMVEIPGMLAVATTFVRPEDVEIVE